MFKERSVGKVGVMVSDIINSLAYDVVVAEGTDPLHRMTVNCWPGRLDRPVGVRCPIEGAAPCA